MEVKDPTGPFLVAWFMCLGISKGVVWFMPWHGGMVLGGMVLDLWGSLSLSLVLQGSPSKSTQPQSARTSWYSSRFFTSKRKLPGWLCRTCMRLDECTCRGGGRTGHRSGSSRDPPTRADQAVPLSEDRSGTEPGACRQRTRPLM